MRDIQLRRRGATKLASAAAIAAVAQFVTAWAVLGLNRDGYDPTSRAISELAELGSPTRGAMTVSLIAFGLLVAPLARTLLRVLPSGRSTAAAVLLNAAGSIGAGAFPCSPGCPGPAASSSDLAHVVAASVAYLGLILAPLATARQLRRVDALRGLRRVCLMLGLLTFAGVTAWVAGVAGEAGGALQRVATTTGDAWYVVVAVAILRAGGTPEGGGRSARVAGRRPVSRRGSPRHSSTHERRHPDP